MRKTDLRIIAPDEFWDEVDARSRAYINSIPDPQLPKIKILHPIQQDGRAKRRERRKNKK